MAKHKSMPMEPSKDEMRRMDAEHAVVRAFRESSDFKRMTKQAMMKMKEVDHAIGAEFGKPRKRKGKSLR